MHLKTIHITNFRSVEDSSSFSVSQVTSLVGKNEAGKSAILVALASLNPHPATPMTLDKERDYPRRYLTNYAERHPDGHATAVTTTWGLSDDDVAAVTSELGANVLKDREITVSRRYGDGAPGWAFQIDIQQGIDNALHDQGFDEAQIASLRVSEDAAKLAELMGTLPSLTPVQQTTRARLAAYGSFGAAVQKVLAERLPTFMYFSSYDRMEGAVQFEQLNQLTANGHINDDDYRGSRLFLEFMDFAGVPLAELLEVKTYETFNAKLQGASNNITDQILEYWTQNPDLEVRVDVDSGKPGDRPPFNTGTVGRARVYNRLHRVDTPFSERSAGFVWFFSFLVKFAQVKAANKPVVLLLDEPGLSLHGKAQADLLRYFDEKLAPKHQIIYSTHSPFMVAPDKLTSARIVEDLIELKGTRRVPIGTKVREDVLSTDPDTLFPLQGALGYEITQTLFIGKHTLLVEGVSDIVYLQALSHALKLRGMSCLDPRWTICPAGGVGNVSAFLSLFGGNRLDVTVLADQTKADAKKLEALRKSQILKAGRVFTVADFTDKAESDIEDLFEASLFVTIVNAAFSLPKEYALTVASLAAADTTTERLVKKAEAAFRVLPEPIPEYDHFSPSSWLLEHPELLSNNDEMTETTLGRAAKLFEAVNKTLAG